MFFLGCQSKKTLKNLMLFSVDNIEKFTPKHNHLVPFHLKAFDTKKFVQDNEISLRWIASAKTNFSW